MDLSADSLPRVSVIVPAFNSELYIEECLHSLFQQSLHDLEIIVVDDGSTDQTAKIVRSLAPPPGKSLRLFSKPNGGLSSARNAGIASAKGRWIGLVDSDDWVQAEMYSRFLECAENEQADLAICLGCVVDAVTQEVEPFRDHALWDALITERIRLLDPARTPDVFLLDTQAGRRLYRRSFLEKTGFKFAEGLVFEDVLASYQLLYRTSRVLLVKEPYYCYRQGHSGRITARKDATILQIIEIMQRVMTELAAHRASAQAWANFIWFQNWVLLWLCSQVEDVHKGEFTAGAIKIARQFPRGGVRYFRDKFANDERAQHGVFLQRLGWGKAYRAFADISEFSSFAKFLFAQKPIHYLIDLWTMSSRSIVLARYFSDERKEGAGLPSLK